MTDDDFNLGDSVRFISEPSVSGVVVRRIAQFRGPTVFDVEYWHDGEPKVATGRGDELERWTR